MNNIKKITIKNKNEIKTLLYLLKKSLQKDINPNNIKYYLALAISIIKKISIINTTHNYDEKFIQNISIILYKFLKHIIATEQAKTLINKINETQIIKRHILDLIQKDTEDFENKNETIDIHLIKTICKKDKEQRQKIEEEIIKTIETLKEENNNIEEHLKLMKQELEEKENLINKNSELLKQIKKKYISIILSISVMIGVFSGANYTLKEISRTNTTETIYSTQIDKNVLNKINILISLILAYLSTYFPKIGLQEVYINFKNLKREVNKTERDILKINFILKDIENRIEENDFLSEEVCLESKTLLKELYYTINYYYLTEEEKNKIKELNYQVKESLTLRNKI